VRKRDFSAYRPSLVLWQHGNVAKVFINYRTSDEPTVAVLLKRELSTRFGADEVFLATRMIAAGDDFERVLLRQVRGAAVLLAVVGRRWLNATHTDGGRALDHPGDWVRREIAEALANGIRVVPVLVGDSPRLTDAPLPADIARLATCQFLRFRPEDFEADLDTVVAELAALLGDTRTVERGSGEQAVVQWARATGSSRIHQAGGDQTINYR
jgi:hypothetical protein